jgi:hypothetical protein
MKAVCLWELFQPGKPAQAIPRLIGQKSHHNEEIDGQSKDVRAI